MSELIGKRGQIKASLTRLVKFFHDLQFEDAVLEQVEERAIRLKEIFQKFEEIQGQIELQSDDDEAHLHMKEREDFEEKYFEARSVAAYLVKQLSNPAQKVPKPLTPPLVPENDDLNLAVQTLMEHQASLAQLIKTNSSVELKNISMLPKLDLPTFNGNYREWPEFFDAFKRLIHENSNYSDSMKLQYLKKSLVGKARDIFRNLPSTDANYAQAYQELTETYDRSELIINSYFEVIFGQRKLATASADGLGNLCNNISESVRALTALGLPTNHWDVILVYILSSKVDDETLMLWRRKQTEVASTQKTTFSEFVTFIRNRIYELSVFNTNTSSHKSTKQSYPRFNQRLTHTTVSPNVTPNCLICHHDHFLPKCPKFQDMSISARRNFVKERRLCFNCLKSTHVSKNCPSKTNCKKCNTRHHTMVHELDIKDTSLINNSSNNKTLSSTSNAVPASAISTYCSVTQSNLITLLPTAVVLIKNNLDQLIPCRILLDSGSQISLISQNCAQKLMLKPSFERRSIHGINSPSPSYSKGSINVTLRSRFSTFEIQTKASILSKLTSCLPFTDLKPVDSTVFNNLELADPRYFKSSKIDLIVGADVFFQVISNERTFCAKSRAVALKTEFGWIISGNTQLNTGESTHVFHTCIDVDNSIKRFWEIEDIQEQSAFTEEEQAVEDHFLKTHSRNPEGRFITRLPFKNTEHILGNSKTAATQRLLNLEKRFQVDSELKQQYSKFLREYLELGHMKIVADSEQDLPDKNCYYMPHHAVIKASSTTTRLRVVFDASQKSSSGMSLNDLLMVGCITQKDIWSLLLNFRLFKIAYTADIAKMYRQVFVHPEDTPFQRILWRNDNKQAIQEFELVTVTYGTASAPYSATRVLSQLATDEEHNFPIGAQVLRDNFYVDDFLGGSHTFEEAVRVKNELSKLLHSGGFDIRKWCSNNQEFLETIDKDHRETSCVLPGESEIAVKTLGMKWVPDSDIFTFEVHLDTSPSLTKRKILSEISKVFDPLGLIGPCTTLAKIFMQRIWISGVDWDDQLPDDIVTQYIKFRTSILELPKLQIPRWVFFTHSSEIQLIGFADASERAYSGVVYVRIVHQGNIFVHLLASKSKLAPIYQISLPRLELCAAHLLTKLIAKVKRALKISDSQIIAYTDSTIVLAWLLDIPRRWKTFIGNRTSYILSHISCRQWHHVKSLDNPADISSRGLTSDHLINNTLWWNGPNFLSSPKFNIHNLSKKHYGTQLEARTVVCAVTDDNTNIVEFHLFQRYSTLAKIQRINSWCYRFINNCKNQIQKKALNKNSFLLVDELQFSLQFLIKFSQNITFCKDISCIVNKKQLFFKSKLRSLDPFIDGNGILRVGGRIQRGHFNFNKKHPIILSKDHILSKLIVEDIHRKYFHSGQQLTLNILHQNYWIVGAKYLVKKCIRLCVTCIRYRANTSSQLMGSLPSFRINPTRPFTNTGVDFAGPIYIRTWRGKGAKILKAYVAVFVCMITRAIHLELVSELTSKAFLATLNRFISRRGACNNIYCDNGKNFVGASRELVETKNFISKNCSEIANKLSTYQIQFHFIPVATPHFGGMWESSVKSMKTHLKRIVGEQKLTFEEMATLLCQIEACLNSRPIAPQSHDINDLEVLTPAHFLTFGALQLPQQEPLDTTKSYSTRWQLIQAMCQHFWRRWSMEYLNSIQKRKKWQFRSRNLMVNDLVLIKEENLPPTQWLMGRIVATKPGKDGVVRVVSVKTRAGIIDRPIHKLCVLLTEEQQDLT